MVIQDFIRTMESPIQQIIYLRDVLEIARKKDRLLQVLQTRLPSGDRAIFEKRMMDKLTFFYGSDVWVQSVERGDVIIWCVGTGPHIRHSFEKLVEAVKNLEHPDDLKHIAEDPAEFSP